MSTELKRTKNNQNPVKFEKEPKAQHSEDEIEIIEVTTGQFNNIEIPFKKEPYINNSLTFDYFGLNKRITRLESENKSLKQNEINLIAEITVLNGTISGLNLKLKKYEKIGENEQSEILDESTLLNFEHESAINLDEEIILSESADESDQDDDETTNKA